jgi:antitoxin (DNA-binding transcriptional repressor) of toxin-antitoxin stability system
MPESIQAVDVTRKPDLLRLAQEVHDTGAPRLLSRAGEPLAKIVPIKTKKRDKRAAAHEAFLRSAASWEGLIDADQFVSNIYESRSRSSRPPVEL